MEEALPNTSSNNENVEFMPIKDSVGIQQPEIVSSSGENKNTPKKSFWRVIIFCIFLLIIFFVYKYTDLLKNIIPNFPVGTSVPKGKIDVKKFSSESEFKTYMEEASQALSLSAGLFGGNELAIPVIESTNLQKSTLPGEAATAERYSETNVQVQGIDEPDIVKTNGKNIFVSSETNYLYTTRMEPSVSVGSKVDTQGIVPPYNLEKTKIISALPVESLAKLSEINKTGNLLLNDNILVIFSGNIIYGFNISEKSNPKEIWKVEIDSRNQIISSRLYQNKLYIALKTVTDGSSCVIPLIKGVTPLDLPCTEIYHPMGTIPADSTFSLLMIDPQNGSVENNSAFVGSGSFSVFYMSQDNLYLTYSSFTDLISYFFNFYNENGKDLITPEYLTKIKNLMDLNISQQAKLTEFSVILGNYKNSLSEDENLKIENDTQNRLAEYTKDHLREMESTGIVKFKTGDLTIVAQGKVPGKPLNQFSLDEYQSNLRIAITISNNFNLGTTSFSLSDVYILDDSLSQIGSVLDLGIGERIYSVRFMGETGYLVTFKQTDPFYVLDLKNPKNPQKTGELKIPGYSSYLHELDTNLILGVGKEEQKVKLSLFDVGDKTSPKEIGKYMMNEYWSEILKTHHAFLLDSKNKIFFIPGSTGAYIFSYKENAIELVKAIANVQTGRALFINNNLYIVSNKKIVVLDESNWEIVKTLEI